MERRDFLRTGLALGAASVGGIGVLPEIALPSPRSSGETLRLNSNENPLGLAPGARSAVIDVIADANRYRTGNRGKLTEMLAAVHELKSENIVLGNGSTEVLQMIVQSLARPNARLVLAEPTFEDVPEYAEPHTYTLDKVPLDARYAHDIGRMREAAEATGERAVVYICNPNNPTATLTPSAEIDEWIESAPDHVYFIIDEAYHEYVHDPAYHTSTGWVTKRSNVIVVRTFSKIYGMAGMRLGYGMAEEETIKRLRLFMGQVNANQLALAAAIASLRDEELVPKGIDSNARGMKVVHDVLEELDLEYLPSHTNFLMHRIPGEHEAYRERMRENDALVGRPFPPMLTYNRLSISTPDDMARFADILRSFRRKGWA